MGFKSRFESVCSVCGGKIAVGEEITWRRSSGAARVRHLACSGQPTPEEIIQKITGAPPVLPAPTPEAIPEPEHTSSTTTRAGARAPIDSAVPATNGAGDTGALDLLAASVWKRIEPKIEKQETDFSALRSEIRREIESLRPKTITVEVKTPDGIQATPNAHKQLPILISLLSHRKNVYLWNATGGGKSYAVPQAAEALSTRTASISLNEQSPDYLVTGYMDANSRYCPSIFYEYFKNGGLLCYEELDNTNANLLCVLNVALANSHYTFPNLEKVGRHPDFYFVGCGNTPGRGANPKYPERKPFDAAFANRFFFLEWLYDEALEEQVALALNPKALPFIAWTRSARTWLQTNPLRLEITPRTTFFLAELALNRHLSKDQLVDGILAGLDTTARTKLLANVPFPAVKHE